MTVDLALCGSLLPGVENQTLSVLRAAAEGAGHTAMLVDFSGLSDLETALEAISRGQPRVCGISMQSTEAALGSMVLCRMLRERGYGGKVVVGGHFATLNAEEILRAPAGVDHVVRFAGERALVGLLGARDASALDALPGLVSLDARGQVQQGGPPDIAPQLGMARVERARPQARHLGYAAADLVTSRGCASRCAYCCVGAVSEVERRLLEARGLPSSRAAYARRGVDSIADEVAELYHRQEVRVLNFMDDNLLPETPPEIERWLDDLLSALGRRKVGRVAISLQLRADVVTPAVADRLVELGLVRAYVGIDAASPGQLRALGRRARASAGAEALALLTERGVFAVCNALLIGPTFDFERVRVEIEALAELRGAPLHLLPIDARRGTPYYERARGRGLIEGSFLWQTTRFEDPRTELLGKALLSLPTRLEERSVPVAAYDLGYNLGIASRLAPGAGSLLGELAREYALIAEAWNVDQIRFLRRAAAVASRRDAAALDALIAEEQPRVRAFDTALLARSDRALVRVERELARALGRPVSAHHRSRLISTALAMSVAACGVTTSSDGGVTGDVIEPREPDAGQPTLQWGTVDAGPSEVGSLPVECPATEPVYFEPYRSEAGPAVSCWDGGVIREASDGQADGGAAEVTGNTGLEAARNCLSVHCEHVLLHFDTEGTLVAASAESGTLGADVADCLVELIGSACYPSLACTIQRLAGHCWIA